MKNYMTLLAEISGKQEEIMIIRHQMESVPGYFFIKAAIDNLGDEKFADRLAYELTQRDEPMDRSEIREVFQASGFDFTERHVSDARPDSQETINEQREYYRE